LKLLHSSANTIPGKQISEQFQLIFFSSSLEDTTNSYHLFCKKMGKAKAKLCGCIDDLLNAKKTTA
jgi:hypothetical protein